jgi:hypothetical protein
MPRFLNPNDPSHVSNFNRLDSFDLEYTGSDPHVYLDSAWGRLLCSRLIVAYVHPALLDYLSQYFGTLPVQEFSVFRRDLEEL